MSALPISNTGFPTGQGRQECQRYRSVTPVFQPASADKNVSVTDQQHRFSNRPGPTGMSALPISNAGFPTGQGRQECQRYRSVTPVFQPARADRNVSVTDQ